MAQSIRQICLSLLAKLLTLFSRDQAAGWKRSDRRPTLIGR
jgi:hypothetical protein